VAPVVGSEVTHVPQPAVRPDPPRAEIVEPTALSEERPSPTDPPAVAGPSGDRVVAMAVNAAVAVAVTEPAPALGIEPALLPSPRPIEPQPQPIEPQPQPIEPQPQPIEPQPQPIDSSPPAPEMAARTEAGPDAAPLGPPGPSGVDLPIGPDGGLIRIHQPAIIYLLIISLALLIK